MDRNESAPPSKILLGVSGSVASMKTISLATSLLNFGEVRVVSTNHALGFFDRTQLPSGVSLFTDDDEWKSWKKRGDPVLHIELRKWADVFVLAPLSANSLAKISHGLCDNLLTCVARAWDFQRPFLVAPAMNTLMWQHPFTEKQLSELRGLGIQVVAPVEKTLICGDTGAGAMAEVPAIVNAVKSHILKENSNKKQKTSQAITLESATS